MNPVGVLLAVVAGLVAIVAVVGVYNSITSSTREGDAISLLNQLRANVETIYSGQSSYGTNTNLVPVLGGFGKIPDSAKKGTGNAATIEHPFGRPVRVVGNGGRFQITFESLDDESCKALGRAYAGRTRSGSGIVRIQVNASVPTTVNNTAPVVRDIAWLNTNCNEGAAANHMTFVFG